jgi:glycosyltransferase involved in cell wall biosynthesis
MSAPTVLHFIETGIPGGAESMLLDLCRHQLAAGLRPMIAHFDHPWFTEHCRAIGVESFALPDRSRFKKSATVPLFAMDFARRMRRGGVALLHSHLFGPIVGGAFAALAGRIPHIGTLHDIHMVEEVPSRIWQLRVALAFGTRLVTVSNHMQDFYRRHLHWAAHRTSCIHNGTDPTRGIVPIARESLGIPAGDTVAIVVGRLVPLKRVGDALQALRPAGAQGGVTLLVAGDGPELEGLRALSAQLGLSGKVRFLGARRDIPALLRTADLFVQCSETEGLSMSIIEALHAGLPCIVTRVGGNPELVRHDYNGALYAPGDRDTLGSWIGALAADPRKRQLMGERSRELALSQYTARACAEAYISLYKSSGLRLS